MFISEIVHTEDSFLLKLYYKFNFATEPILDLLTIDENRKLEMVFELIDDLDLEVINEMKVRIDNRLTH